MKSSKRMKKRSAVSYQHAANLDYIECIRFEGARFAFDAVIWGERDLGRVPFRKGAASETA